MAECKAPAVAGIPEALGLKTFTMDGQRWVLAGEAGSAVGYSAGALTHRLTAERQFVRNRDYRVLRGTRLARVAKALGLDAHSTAVAVLTEAALEVVVATRRGDVGEQVRAMVLAEKQPEPAPEGDRLGLARHVFEGHDVPTITIAGQQCWIASDVGRVLEYGRDGRGLVQAVGHDWKAEFIEGEHVVVAKGEILGEIRSLALQIGATELQNPKIRHLTLLTRAGLWLVLDKTEKPVGQRFRRWLSGEVREAAEQGRAVTTGMDGKALPAPVDPGGQLSFDFAPSEAEMARERRLLVLANHRHAEAERKIDLEVGKLRVDFAEKVVGWDLADPLKREVVRATAKAIGLEVGEVA